MFSRMDQEKFAEGNVYACGILEYLVSYKHIVKDATALIFSQKFW